MDLERLQPRPEDRERQATLNTVGTSLRDRGLDVELEPPIGGTRPDIVATRAGQWVYIIELKTGEGPVHFSLISQLLSFKTIYESMRPGLEVAAVLATTREVPERVAAAAERSGVRLIIESSIAALAKRLADAVTSAA